MLVVLDTNVLLSAFIRVDSNPYKVVQAWFDDRHDLVSSPAQIEELTRASRYPRVREAGLLRKFGRPGATLSGKGAV